MGILIMPIYEGFMKSDDFKTEIKSQFNILNLTIPASLSKIDWLQQYQKVYTKQKYHIKIYILSKL